MLTVIGRRTQRLYDSLPVFGQTALLNVYGIRTRRLMQRYDELLSAVVDSETWPVECQKEHVAEKLRTLLEHAIRHVPRYQSLIRLIPELRDDYPGVLDVLREFPPVTRAEVLESPSSFLSNAFHGQALATTSTTGTTGSPMKTVVEPAVLDLSNALWWRRTVWAGFEPGDWTARLVGDRAVPLREVSPKRPYRISYTDRRLYLSTFHLDSRTAVLMKRLLEERRPAFLQGYPSALTALSTAGPCDHGWRPKAVLYSSEPLYEHQRAAINSFVDAPIRGLYGCAERIVSAAECASASLHLSVLDGYVEGQYGEPRSSGPALVTGLLNRAMPLIRFQLGDLLVLRPDVTCPCGRTLPVLSPVVTKAEDSVLTPSGRVISPSALTWAFKDVPGLKKSQIVQHPDFSLEVRVMTDAADLADISRLLQERLRQMTFGELSVKVTGTADLEVTSAGKTRFVIRMSASSDTYRPGVGVK